jgi:hypothetical protein
MLKIACSRTTYVLDNNMVENSALESRMLGEMRVVELHTRDSIQENNLVTSRMLENKKRE